jgi:uncharacterized protein (TIGR03435 family)
VRRIALSILVLAFGARVVAAQTFEVASVKSAPPLDPQKILSGQMRVGTKVAGSNVDIESVTLPELLYQAFNMRPSQMKGPEWLNVNMTDPMALLSAPRFDIHAKLPAGGSQGQVPEMLQALLTDRFKLAAHHEQKEQNVYALVVGKNGAKLEPSPPDDPKPADGAPQTARPDPIQMSVTSQGMTMRGAGKLGAVHTQMGQDGIMHMVADKMTMEMLATSVERFVDRPVVDQTELQGNYKVSFEIPMSEMMAAVRAGNAGAGNAPPGFGGGAGTPAAAVLAPVGNAILQSVEKMGLKLEPRRASVDYLVIDHLEKTPTED